jgi:hypothetical protein
MIVTETSGRFTSTRASRGSSDVVVVSLVGLPLVRAAGLLPIALILITAGCGPPS